MTCNCARVRVNDPPEVRLAVHTGGEAVVGIDQRSPLVPAMDEYEGPYEVTPGATAQTLATRGLLSTADIVVNPIPSNYGLIQWNGAVLTVS